MRLLLIVSQGILKLLHIQKRFAALGSNTNKIPSSINQPGGLNHIKFWKGCFFSLWYQIKSLIPGENSLDNAIII